jgi:hypothetical protein
MKTNQETFGALEQRIGHLVHNNAKQTADPTYTSVISIFVKKMSSLVEKSYKQQPNGRYLFNPCTVAESLGKPPDQQNHHSLTDVKNVHTGPKKRCGQTFIRQSALFFGNRW